MAVSGQWIIEGGKRKSSLTLDCENSYCVLTDCMCVPKWECVSHTSVCVCVREWLNLCSLCLYHTEDCHGQYHIPICWIYTTNICLDKQHGQSKLGSVFG